MRRQIRNMFVWVLILIPFLSACITKGSNSLNADLRLQQKLELLKPQIAVNPRLAIDTINKMMLSSTDSLYYYSLLAMKAQSMMFLSKLDSMKLLLQQSLAFCQREENQLSKDMLLVIVYNTCGNYYSRIALMDSANYYFKHAFVSARNVGLRSSLPDISINVADSYVRIGRYDLAAYWFWKSISLCDSLNISEEKRFPSYMGLAQVSMELQDFDACDSLFMKAEKSYDKMHPYEQHFYLNTRGNSYYFRKDYKTALHYFRRSQELLADNPHMLFERHLTNINLGEIFLLLNEVDSASYYLESCKDFFYEVNNVTALYYIDTQLIELAVRQKNMALARKRLKEAVTPEYVEPNMLHIRYRYLQHYYEENGDFKQAYHYLKLNKRIDDSIRNERVRMRSSESALKYKVSKAVMQKEILIRQQENQVLRLNQWIYILVFGTLSMVAFIWAFFLYRRRKNEKKVWDMQTSINSLRLDNVRNRISPHFIFNVLTHEMDRFQNVTDKSNMQTIVHLLRRQLELADQLSISLADELDFVNCFLKLEKSSLGEDFEFVLEVDKSVDLNSLFVPSMSIYLLVENAVKHSLTMKDGKRKLWIRIVDQGERIVIKLCDNGGGFKAASSTMGTGTGFKIITRTIQLYNQYNTNLIYMNIHNVDVGDAEIGCEVSYSIPKNYKFIIKN